MPLHRLAGDAKHIQPYISSLQNVTNRRISISIMFVSVIVKIIQSSRFSIFMRYRPRYQRPSKRRQGKFRTCQNKQVPIDPKRNWKEILIAGL